jgi:hypothetical protein
MTATYWLIYPDRYLELRKTMRVEKATREYPAIN